MNDYAEEIRSIIKKIEKIKEDLDNGIVKDTSSRNSPVIFNSIDFQGGLSMTEGEVPLDPFSLDEKDIERRENLLSYYADIRDAFDGRDFESKSYIKGN